MRKLGVMAAVFVTAAMLGPAVEAQTVPSTPTAFTASRNSSFTRVTLSWYVSETVVEYQIQRKTAVEIIAGDASGLEYETL